MYLPGEQPRALEPLLERYERVCQTMEPITGSHLQLMPGSDCAAPLTAGQWVQVLQGAVEVRMGDRVAVILQPGDLFLIPPIEPDWPLAYVAVETGVISLLDRMALASALDDSDFARHLAELMMLQNTAMTLAYAAANRYGIRPKAGFQRLEAGTVLIESGSPPGEVFTLMRGRARVELDGVELGYIEEGDIFGVLSALTDSPRNATIVAETDVTLMAVPGDQFIRLVQAQPETFMRLLRTLSRQMGELNQRLVDALRQPHGRFGGGLA